MATPIPVTQLPSTSYQGHDRPFAVKISRLSCRKTVLLGTPPPSPHTKESVQIGDRKIDIYKLHDAGIEVIKGQKGSLCQNLSKYGKFYEFNKEKPMAEYMGIHRWIFKQECVFPDEQLTLLNERMMTNYGHPNAYQKDSKGYLHTTLRALCQNVMAEAFGLNNHFIPSCLAFTEDNTLGLLLPYFENSINVDEWLNRHDILLKSVQDENERQIIQKNKTEKNRYLDPEYNRIANDSFKQLFPETLKAINFVDQRSNQPDRSKLSNLLLIGDPESNDISTFRLLAIDQDLAFAHLQGKGVTGRESDLRFDFPDKIPQAKPCCQQWIDRLLELLTPILPDDSDAIAEAIRDDLNTIYPFLTPKCAVWDEPYLKSTHSSPHSSAFSGSGGHITPADLSPGSSLEGLALPQSTPVVSPLGVPEIQIAPLAGLLIHPQRIQRTVPYASVPSSSRSTEFELSSNVQMQSPAQDEYSENLPSLDSITSLSTVISAGTLAAMEEVLSEPDSPTEHSQRKRPRLDDPDQQ